MPVLLSFLMRFFFYIMVGLVDRFRNIEMLLVGLLLLFTTIFFPPIIFMGCCWLLPPSSSIIKKLLASEGTLI